MPNQADLSIWKKHFLFNKNLDTSNQHMNKILKALAHSIPFVKSFEEISKNEGVSFLFLDPSETHMQLLHHGSVLGGNWSSSTKLLVAVLGTENDAKPIQIIKKSIKIVKEKSFDWDSFEAQSASKDDFVNMKNPTEEFHFKNIIPIPNLLTKVFIQLPSTSPFDVAKAFLSAELNPNKSEAETLENILDISSDLTEQEKSSSKEDSNEEDLQATISDTTGDKSQQNTYILKEDILHVIQFCHLCAMGKIPPTLYSLASDSAVKSWFDNLPVAKLLTNPSKKRSFQRDSRDSEDDSEVSSPENKISKKDHYLINTMIKLHDTMDKTSKIKEDKEPGFKRLESHRKKLILNASAVSPFTEGASNPTEFYSSFLSKRSQFKAKDMLMHQFYSDKIAFNPNASFVTNLWNCEFFWILPDSPSGVSIFYCPESKSSNSYELEKERNLALADKVNTADIDKLTKQKMTIPTQLMDLVWTTQNFHSVISLCFGPKSHSALFLQEWIDHIYGNRLIYSSAQANDPYFFAKILFTMDNALQKHWRSCSSAQDR